MRIVLCYYDSMQSIIIPKTFTRQDDLIVIPRKEYEELLDSKRAYPVFEPTKSDLKALAQARKEFKEGKLIEWEVVKNELENLPHKRRKKTA